MRLRLGWIVALLVVSATGLAPRARAQMDSREGIALQNQVLELRRDIQVLRDQLARSAGSNLGGGRPPPPQILSGGPSGNDITASLVNRVARLEDDMRGLRGRMDEIENASRRQAEDLSKQIADLAFRLDNSGGRSAPAVAPQAPGNSAGPPPIPSGGPAGRRTPELAMQEGNAALARRDYQAAEAAAREVLSGPKTPRTLDAQFLLARALLGKKDFSAAAVAYDDSYNRAHAGPHAADSLLGLATSLTNLGEKRAACATMDKMKAEFPTPRQDLRDQVTNVRQQAGCR